MGVEDRSEYDGGGVMPNTVYPKDTEALSNSDKLRLMSLTGQTEDSRAARDPYFWHGNERPDKMEERAKRLTENQRRSVIRNAESSRYRESPY